MAKRRDGPAGPRGGAGDKGAGVGSFGLTLPDLETMDRDGLLALWQGNFDTPAPKGMSLTFLRRYLAFDLQARQHGALPAALLTRLDRFEAGQERAATPSLKAGGRLLREWNGVTHVIDVTPDGYRWQGQCHRSLSAIARAITGAQWSGPRFFGLKETKDAGGRIGSAGARTATDRTHRRKADAQRGKADTR